MMSTLIINPRNIRNLGHSKITFCSQLSGVLVCISVAVINSMTKSSFGMRGLFHLILPGQSLSLVENRVGIQSRNLEKPSRKRAY